MKQLKIIGTDGEQLSYNIDWFDELTNTNSDKKATDMFKLYAVYKYLKKGKDKKAVIEDKRWDAVNLKTSMPAAKKILQVFEGDVKKAAQAILEIGEYFEKSLDGPWTLHAVFRRITDWEEGRLNGNR